MKHFRDFASFLSESAKLAYWTDYAEDTSGQAAAWMSEPCTVMSKAYQCINKAFDEWNENSDAAKIDKEKEDEIGVLALDYFKQFKMLNGNIVTAMIAQES